LEDLFQNDISGGSCNFHTDRALKMLWHGIDLVDIAQLTELLDAPDSDYAVRCFTAQERVDAGEGPHRAERLAGRLAAKEAVLKALGTGWTQGIAWTDIEVETQPSGAPTVRLHRRAALIAAESAIDEWAISISHTATCAVASVIAVARTAPAK
jgi:holo-[acyl-carrier protein] synthase